jgi:Pyruvate/2-oxoacid:ferredoxin oxidoreductase gamma subunit
VSRPVAIVMTGRGGQGGKLAMELLAWSASAGGLVPVLYSIYGALIRGGDVASFLVAGEDDPGVALRDSYDVMCAMHNNWFGRYYALLRPGGVLAADPAHVTGAMQDRDDVRSLAAPWSELAAGAGDRRSANMVAAGAVAAISGIATPAALEEGMHAVVPAHRAARIAGNLAAVRAGYDWAARQADVPA